MQNHISNSISCDILMPVTKPSRFIYLMNKTIGQPQWLRHSFVIVLDNLNSTDEQKIKDWYYANRIEKNLPEVIILNAPANIHRNRAALFQTGLQASSNPYVYFQNERDELPINIDRCIKSLYENKKLVACFGQCETYLKDGTKLEEFPIVGLDHTYKYDCIEATKLFPSYAHPLSAVFKKSLFKTIPYWDPKKILSDYSYYYFVLQILQNHKFKVEYKPYTIKISNRENTSAALITQKVKKDLIKDMKVWIDCSDDNRYKNFQREILNLLESNEITTFKEIDARIEDYLDRNK